jgi:hypothetical protein
MDIAPAMTEVKEEHLEELANLTGDFLGKYFSQEFISTLEIEVKFIRKEKELAVTSFTMGCILGQPEDLIRCNPGQKWGKKP